MEKNRVIGFFGGTFDPPHLGHIQLALALKEKGNLDAVFFCPTFLSPSKKKHQSSVSPQDRLAMVKRAIEPVKEFHLIEEEIHSKRATYTIDTIRSLYQKYPKAQFRVLLGEDHLSTFSSWKEANELLKIAPPLVGLRTSYQGENPLGLEIIETPLFDISASEIRFRLKNGLYVGHLIPHLVLEYIHEKKLYL